MTNPIFKGDDTGAFGNSFITINLDNPLNYEINKALFICGRIQKPIEKPEFPLVINFNSNETETLKTGANVCYLIVYDSQGRQKTCKGALTFNAQNGVICNNGTCC